MFSKTLMSPYSFVYFIFLLILHDTHSRQTTSRLPPTHYFIFGDKFAGVKYLSKILNNTSPALPLQECQIHVNNPSKKKTKLKHNTVEQYEEELSSWRYGFFTTNDLKKNLDCDIERTLFILIVKDVRSMLCSVARRKFKTTKKKLVQMHLNALIVNRFNNDDDEEESDGSGLQLNGSAAAPSKINNYLKMRTQKLKIHYSIISRMKHGVVIR